MLFQKVILPQKMIGEQKIMNSPQKLTFEAFRALRESLALPLKIKMFYVILEESMQKSKTSAISKDQIKKHKLFLSIFKKLCEEEKLRFLLDSLKLVRLSLSVKQQDSTSSENDTKQLIRQIQTTCKVKQSVMGFAKWEKKSFRFSLRNHKIRVGEGKNELVLSLPYYLARKSNKFEKTLILEAISQRSQVTKSEVYLYFDNNILYQEIYNHIFNSVIEVHSKQICRMTNEKQDLQDTTVQTNDQMTKASIILTPKLLNQYFELKQKFLSKLQNSGYTFENVETTLPNTKIGLSRHKNKDRIKIEKVYNGTMKEVEANLTFFKRETDSRLVQYQVLQNFSSNINVVYFKYLFNHEVYEFLTILQQSTKNEQKILVFKGIDNFINKQFIDFLYIRLKFTGGKVVVRLVGIIKNEQKNKSQAADFLLSLMETTKTEVHTLKTEEFWTVRQIENIQMQDQPSCIEPQWIPRGDPNRQEKIVLPSSNTLSKLFILQAQAPVNIFMDEHPLFTEWRLFKAGGVICTNEEQINVQKKVFKHIISQIGSNIMQRKNILNVSFPITIFKKQSHLKSLARNFLFAPIFFDRVVNAPPQERIKATVLFQISTAILVISMNKPFNPILGETYQGTIDGCPVFLEQTSHHPPISNFLFQGRGYRIHGFIAPKIALGLNCVKGWSPPSSFIQFDDGTTIEFTMNKMVINGMLFGERTFNFEGINFVLDKKNKMMAEISYGPDSNTAFKKKQLTCDSVSGAIYDLKSSNAKLDIDSLKKVTGERVQSFIGKWHSEVLFQGKKVFNFLTDFPHQLFDTEQPLPSDSRFRADLMELIKQDLEQAQVEKQYLQEQQRRDKRLRQEHRAKRKA